MIAKNIFYEYYFIIAILYSCSTLSLLKKNHSLEYLLSRNTSHSSDCSSARNSCLSKQRSAIPSKHNSYHTSKVPLLNPTSTHAKFARRSSMMAGNWEGMYLERTKAKLVKEWWISNQKKKTVNFCQRREPEPFWEDELRKFSRKANCSRPNQSTKTAILNDPLFLLENIH